MADGTDGPEIDLIQESVGNASARIRFFRIAFGAAGEQMMGRAEVISILDDLMEGSRLNVAWGPLDPQPRTQVRLAFLALQCLETAMPYGGRVEVSNDGTRWLLHGRADKLNLDEALWNVLTTQDPPPDLRPAHVQFALLPTVAADENRSIKTETAETDIKLSF